MIIGGWWYYEASIYTKFRFGFVAPNGKKTNRLLDKIMNTSTKLSSVTASALLKNSSIKVCKSSICDLLKKNANYCG